MNIKLNKKLLKKQSTIVVNNNSTQEVDNLIIPNGLQVGIDDPEFKKGLKVFGNSQIVGTLNAENLLINGIQVSTGSSTGSSGAVAGSNKQIQFNDSGSFGANSNFFFEKATNTLTVTNISGSLTKLSNGQSFLVAGDGIIITTQSNGSVLFATASGGGGGGTINADSDQLILSIQIFS